MIRNQQPKVERQYEVRQIGTENHRFQESQLGTGEYVPCRSRIGGNNNVDALVLIAKSGLLTELLVCFLVCGMNDMASS